MANGPFKMNYKNTAFPFKGSPAKHTDDTHSGTNLDPTHAAAHNKKHDDNPNWGEDHKGSTDKKKAPAPKMSSKSWKKNQEMNKGVGR